MLTNAILFERELRRLVSEEIARLKENLTTVPEDTRGPNSISYLQGSISALRGIDDLIEEAKKRSDQSSR